MNHHGQQQQQPATVAHRRAEAAGAGMAVDGAAPAAPSYHQQPPQRHAMAAQGRGPPDDAYYPAHKRHRSDALETLAAQAQAEQHRLSHSGSHPDATVTPEVDITAERGAPRAQPRPRREEGDHPELQRFAPGMAAGRDFHPAPGSGRNTPITMAAAFAPGSGRTTPITLAPGGGAAAVQQLQAQLLQQNGAMGQQPIFIIQQPPHGGPPAMTGPGNHYATMFGQPAPVMIPNGDFGDYYMHDTSGRGAQARGGRIYRTRHHRTDPEVVEWLHANFESKRGYNLPRQTVYKLFCKHAKSIMDREVNNAAGFGKIVRSAFPTVTSRRLGSRGKSRYHYDTLRIKPSSSLSLEEVGEDPELMYTTAPRVWRNTGGQFEGNKGKGKPGPRSTSPTAGAAGDPAAVTASDPTAKAPDGMTMDKPRAQPKAAAHKLHPQNPSTASLMMTHMDMGVALAPQPLPANLEDKALEPFLVGFQSTYRQHCEQLLNVLRKSQLNKVSVTIQAFWEVLSSSLPEQLLTPDACRCLEQWDTIFYNTLLRMLVPNPAEPLDDGFQSLVNTLAGDLFGAVRTLAKHKSLQDSPVLAAKLAAVDAMARSLARRLALAKCAKPMAAVVASKEQLDAMAQDLSRLDIAAIVREAGWACASCPAAAFEAAFTGFKELLAEADGVAAYTKWVETMIEAAITRASSAGTPDIESVAKTFTIAWTLVSSNVLRDLTINAAPSFGSYNVVRVFLSEYLSFFIEGEMATLKLSEQAASVANAARLEKQQQVLQMLPPVDEQAA